MPNPDDLIENATPEQAKPTLRQQISAAEPARQAGGDVVRQRIADVAARQAPPIVVNAEGQAAAPGSLRDKLAVNAGASQADARALAQRMSPPTLTDVITPGTPPQAAPAQSGLRERLAARANAAPSAAEQALQQRLGGGIAQAAQQAAGSGEIPRLSGPASGASFAPGATSAPSSSTVFVDSGGNAAAPGAQGAAGSRAVAPAGRAAPGNLVPQGPGARIPVRPGTPDVVDITPSNSSAARAVTPAGPGATPPSSARGVVPAGPGASAPEPAAAPAKAPSTKPAAPPVRPGVSIVNGAGDATVPNPGLRDQLTVGANQAQLDRQAVADRMAAGPKPATPRPDVGAMRQQLGLHPTPPGESALGKVAGKWLGNADEWKALGKRVAPIAGKVGKWLGAGAIADGAYNAYEGVRQGDLGRAAWGVGDAIAGVASFTPAKPLAMAYLGGRTLYEAGHAAADAFGKKPAAAAAPAAKPAAAAAPATAPAAKPEAAPAEKPAAAKPATAPAASPAPRQPNYSNMAANARDEALGAIDDEEAADPRAVYYQTVDHNTGTTTYETRDRGQITVKGDGSAVNPEDQKRIDEYTARQDKRDAVEQRYQQMLAQLKGEQENAGPVADAARSASAGGGNANVTAFVQQYGEAAKAAGEKLGVDPNLLLTQWGHETGWGKSVIPGTNNLGNIKAAKGQAGVAATDNMTGSRDSYAQYASPHEFADQYVNLVQTRYPGAVGAGSDMGKFATALKAGGYAEDPAYVNKLQAAYRTMQGAGGAPQAPAQALDPREVRDPLAGAVQVIDMNTGNRSVTWPGMGSVYNGMSQEGYDATRAALQKNPALAERLQVTDRGPMVDGVYVPPNVMAGGDGEMAKYARSVAQGQRFAANPTSAKLAEEAMRGEYANAGHQIQAGASRYTADQHVESARVAAAAGNKRYLELKGRVNPQTYTPEGDNVFDTQTGQYVPLPGSVPQQQGQPQIPQAAIDMLKKQPQTAAQFDAQFGAGASKRYLQGN